MNETISIEQFIEENLITMDCESIDENPHMESKHSMRHYRCTLKMGTMRMSVFYSMGMMTHTSEPELSDVLDCMASDASEWENAKSFEDWCNAYDYDTDSRRAERIYNNVGTQSRKLQEFLGDELYQKLLWETERS